MHEFCVDYRYFDIDIDIDTSNKIGMLHANEGSIMDALKDRVLLTLHHFIKVQKKSPCLSLPFYLIK